MNGLSGLSMCNTTLASFTRPLSRNDFHSKNMSRFIADAFNEVWLK